MRRATRTVLLTGFGPFPGVPDNVSMRVVEALAFRARRLHPHHRFVTAELPTEWHSGTQWLTHLVDTHQPALSLHFGVSRRAEAIVVETRARNACAAADATGRVPACERLDPAGPDERAATVPTARIVARLRAAGLPAQLSSDAGHYLCNAILFHALGLHAGSRMPAQAGFIHIPHDLGAARWPRLPIRRRLPLDVDRAVAGASIALATCLARRPY
ncbi:MAG: pyroglutamyl-peptidase I [Hyphomicrobiaceae bacterium]